MSVDMFIIDMTTAAMCTSDMRVEPMPPIVTVETCLLKKRRRHTRNIKRILLPGAFTPAVWKKKLRYVRCFGKHIHASSLQRYVELPALKNAYYVVVFVGFVMIA